MYVRTTVAAAAMIALAGCNTDRNETYRSYPSDTYPNSTYQNDTYPNSGTNSSKTGEWNPETTVNTDVNAGRNNGQSSGQMSGQNTGQTGSQQIGSQSNAGQLSDVDRDFVQQAATSGMFEVQSAQLALDRNVDAQTKQNARMLIADHQAANQELKSIGRRDNFDVPSDMQREQQNKLDQLRNSTGSDFAQLYHQMQLQGHKDAIALFEKEASSGQNPDLRSFAQRTLPTLRKHLDHIQNNPVNTSQNQGEVPGDNDMEAPDTGTNP